MVFVGLVMCLMLPALAVAAPPGSAFSCRASAARVALAGGVPAIEPFVANKADSPCKTDSADVLTPTTIGPLMANAVNVSTTQRPPTLTTAPLQNGDNATASSTVTNPTLTLGALVVHADVLTAQAAYTCQNGTPMASNSGQVAGLTINGQSITVPPGNPPNQTVPLGPLGSLVLNQVDTSQPGRITRRAVALTTPLGTVVISEATADIAGNPCAITAATPPAAIPGKARLVVTPRSAARLIARGRCVRSFVATVVGQQIARVVFSLNGRQISVARHAPFRTRVRATPGRDTLLARVTFTSSSHTAPRTLRLRFVGCRNAPRFTG